MQLMKQSETTTNRLEVALLVTKTADNTAYTSNLLNSEIRIVKPGTSPANATNGSTHLANGLHRFILTQAEVDTLGVLKIQINQPLPKLETIRCSQINFCSFLPLPFLDN